jgi:hypothetical protein
MSMTQEEIEALMNATVSDEPEEPAPTEDNFDDILAGIDGVIEDAPTPEAEDNMDDILAGIDGIIEDAPTPEPEDNMDDILAGIEGITDDEPTPDITNNMDDILAGIDGISDDEPKKEDTLAPNNSSIDNGVYPLPVTNEHQVVNQLNEVAEDSEEKASQIFDVLSFILDENDVLQKNISNITSYIDGQLELLNTLNAKFPNIELFSQKIEESNNIKTLLSDTGNTIDGENNKVFEAMELMQYHDINRQKIERVMAVIKKLANYLNGIFSDDSGKAEVQIAKHISGDGQDTVDDADLESLVAEFNN